MSYIIEQVLGAVPEIEEALEILNELGDIAVDAHDDDVDAETPPKKKDIQIDTIDFANDELCEARYKLIEILGALKSLVVNHS
jgi:hypothetical protein